MTILTQNRDCLFGDIVECKMVLNNMEKLCMMNG